MTSLLFRNAVMRRGLRILRHRRSTTTTTTTMRSFHFATHEYAACFQNLPEPDPAYFRHQAVDYLRSHFDARVWYDRPVCSLLRGERLTAAAANDGGDDSTRDTHNALGSVNGAQVWSTVEEFEALRRHISTYTSPTTDQRDVIRQVEEDLMTHHAGFLIGHQCVDFGKQDGVTEIEEAVMANTVERRLNDQVLAAEARGEISVDRRPVYVACVSNFSNFLDLSRKTLRSLEVGVPVVLLGRSHTSQHVFRWTELLLDLACKQPHGMDAGMITYLNGSVDDLQNVLQTCEAHTGNLYATCSRELAATLKATYPRTVASTGGPNTLVLTSNDTKNNGNPDDNNRSTGKEMSSPQMVGNDDYDSKRALSKAVQSAIRTSAAIESAGQCTALRHCVVPPDTSDDALEGLWNGTTTLSTSSAEDALRAGGFDGVFDHNGTPSPPSGDDHDGEGYRHPPHQPTVSYRVGERLPDGLPEYWRQVAVDFTRLDLARSADDRRALCGWLNRQQPISLAVNGPRKQVLDMGMELFDHTGLVVYTLGSTDDPDTMPPAMTCQARPQDGEVFGEFPPRSDASKYSLFPVIVPSSNPSYGATYTTEYLKQQQMDPYWSASTRGLVQAVQDDLVRGYTMTLIRYLQAVDMQNPRVGRTSHTRTTVWGLQRPPLGQSAHLYVTADAAWDAVAPVFLLYYVTKARDQMILTLHPDNTAVKDVCERHDIPYHTAERSEWQAQIDVQAESVFFHKVIDGVDLHDFPMASLYALRYLPAGHIKSTAAHDEEFVFRFKGLSQKWLTTLF